MQVNTDEFKNNKINYQEKNLVINILILGFYREAQGKEKTIDGIKIPNGKEN